MLLVALVGIPGAAFEPRRRANRPPSAPVTPAAGAGGPLSAFQPAVTTEGKKSSEIRKDLEGFNTKNPFKPQNVGGGGGGTAGGSVEVQAGDASASGGSTDASVTDAPPLGTSGGGSGDSGSSTGTSGTTTTKTFYYTYAADVRFGKEGNLDRKTLTQFRSLPSSQDPVLVFMGVKEDGETAIFLQSRGRIVDRRGQLRARRHLHFPLHEEGRRAAPRGGERERRGHHLQLVLLDIDVKRTTGPRRPRAPVAASGRTERRIPAAEARAQSVRPSVAQSAAPSARGASRRSASEHRVAPGGEVAFP